METIVLKFGGSSLADNIKLNIVANKIIDFYNKKNKVIVVVSAQGKTTDGLIKEAKELSYNPDKREMDVLLSTGEQISISKLAILLKRLGYKAVSLTGWQAGIYTSSNNEEAKVEYINTERNKYQIVVLSSFDYSDTINVYLTSSQIVKDLSSDKVKEAPIVTRSEVEKYLDKIDPMTLSPLDALSTLIELKKLNDLTNFFIVFAEDEAKERHIMTMQNWIDATDDLLKFRRKKILENAGSISHKEAIEKAENEYEKFKVKQDMQYISSMDEMYQRYLDENKQNS